MGSCPWPMEQMLRGSGKQKRIAHSLTLETYKKDLYKESGHAYL